MLRSLIRGKAARETFEMTVAGLDAPVTVHRSPRARRLSLRVSEARRAGVLTIPAHTSLESAGAFLAQHHDWLRARLALIPAAVPFADGSIVPLRGEDHALAFVGAARRRGVVWSVPAAERGADTGLPRLCVAGDPAHAPRRLKDWLKREARRDLTARTRWHATRLGLGPARISVRDQTTRWGSCSASGVLSFSWRVVLAPPFVLDYLAAHEVAHLKEMNHGPAFWALVRKTLPTMDEGRGWLKRHGGGLHRYGAES